MSSVMARFFTESEISLGEIRSRRIAVLGYGSQGRAQALNLRDSGLDVTVGLYEGSPSIAAATADNLAVVATELAVQTCDVIMFCVSDIRMRHIYAESVQPFLRPGKALLFSHGFNIHYGLIEPPPSVDVILVSPKGAGPGVRKNYEDGFGVPALVAIHQDATGKALSIALGYAWGIGSARVLILETSFREETETDLFGEQAVLCGGIPEVIKAGFHTLVDAGYAPEAAYFECLHEAKLIVDLLYERGLSGMRDKISDTAEWGGLTSGPRVIDASTQTRMRSVLDDIQSGAFTERWLREDEQGRPELRRLARVEAEDEVERIGRILRHAMRLQD